MQSQRAGEPSRARAPDLIELRAMRLALRRRGQLREHRLVDVHDDLEAVRSKSIRFLGRAARNTSATCRSASARFSARGLLIAESGQPFTDTCERSSSRKFSRSALRGSRTTSPADSSAFTTSAPTSGGKRALRTNVPSRRRRSNATQRFRLLRLRVLLGVAPLVQAYLRTSFSTCDAVP